MIIQALNELVLENTSEEYQYTHRHQLQLSCVHHHSHRQHLWCGIHVNHLPTQEQGGLRYFLKAKIKKKFGMEKKNLNIENAKVQFLSKYLWVLIWLFGSHSNIQRILWDHRLLNKTLFLSWTVVVSTGQLFIALLTTPKPFSVSNRYNTGLSWMSFTPRRTHKVLDYFNFIITVP